jgi:hypothetical protein
MTELNEHQNRALWATALHALADAINSEAVNPPTAIQMFTQYVDFDALLYVADFTDPSNPLPIKILDSAMCVVKVPVGRRLGIDMDWTYFAKNITPEQREAAEIHNRVCATR